MPDSPIRPWLLASSQPLGHFKVFSLRSDEKVSPRTGLPHSFFVIETVHWVNVIALTPDEHVVMVEQFRHGTNTVELEIPGGMIDPEDPTPVAAGTRELREETGYVGTSASLLGEVFPNPAIMNNTCYTVLVRDCQLQHPPQWDGGEDMVTRLVPLAQLPSLLATGAIRHSLVVVALQRYLLTQPPR